VSAAYQILVLAGQASEQPGQAAIGHGRLHAGGTGLQGHRPEGIDGVAGWPGASAPIGPRTAVALKGFRQALRALSIAAA